MSEAAIRQLLARLEDAWARGDGKAYGAEFTADATYVTFVGTVYRGAAEIGAAHQVLFDKFLRGTKLAGHLEEIRFVSDGVAVVASRGDVYKGHRPPARLGKVQTYTVVREADGQWRVAAFHNTKRRRLLEAISFRFAPQTAPAAVPR